MTANIQKFLETAYTDEKLAALLAHAQDGKLAYSSCCCLIGIPGADHALVGAGEYCGPIVEHVNMTRAEVPYAAAAEFEFCGLGVDERLGHPLSDVLRRERLIPLILAEQSRRAAMRPTEAREELVTA
jgi:hypothetical protein